MSFYGKVRIPPVSLRENTALPRDYPVLPSLYAKAPNRVPLRRVERTISCTRLTSYALALVPDRAGSLELSILYDIDSAIDTVNKHSNHPLKVRSTTVLYVAEEVMIYIIAHMLKFVNTFYASWWFYLCFATIAKREVWSPLELEGKLLLETVSTLGLMMFSGRMPASINCSLAASPRILLFNLKIR